MMMGTEILLFGPKGAEKMTIKDFNLQKRSEKKKFLKNKKKQISTLFKAN